MPWVMFDYGAVICTPQPADDLAALAAAAGAGVAEFQAAYWASRRAYDAAALTTAAYWQDVAGRLGASFTSPQIADLIRLDVASWGHLREDTVRLIRDLRREGRRLALLSNAPGELARAVAGLPVATCFEHLLFSCDLGVAKPDPRCFGRALGRLGAAPEEVILIDDREENVIAATGLGMHAIRFTGPEQARAALTGIFATGGSYSVEGDTPPSWILAVQKLSVRSERC